VSTRRNIPDPNINGLYEEIDKCIEVASDSAVDALQNVVIPNEALGTVLQLAQLRTRPRGGPAVEWRTQPHPAVADTSGSTLKGRIKWFNSRDGMGYIAVGRGFEVPVHCQDFEVFSRAPKAGDQVEFAIVDNRACQVRLTETPDAT
jgi:cold shock CspA family protein